MVSFQCDACQDVVKKPKLDAHFHNRCRGTFTCVDCSKTFRTPAEWKGHTSCISEAEKYQKGLYKGKKSDPNRSTDPRGDRPQNPRDDVTSNPNGAEPEQAAETKPPKKSNEPAQGHSQPNKVAFSTSQDNAPDTIYAKDGRKEGKKKNKRETEKAQGEVAIVNDDTKKKKKKRKLDASENNVGAMKVGGAAESQTKRDDVIPASTEPGKLDAEAKKEKKKRKTKSSIKEGEVKEAGAPPVADSRSSADNDKLHEKKHKKKSKKDASEEGSVGLIAIVADDAIDQSVAKKKKKKERKEKSAEEDKLKEERVTNAGTEDTALENGKLHKKRKRSETEGGGDDGDGGSKKAKKERKKDKKEKRKADAVQQKSDKSV